MSSHLHSLPRQTERPSFSRCDKGPLSEALDPEMEDLIYSWRRIADPALRRIALGVIRAMAG